MKQFVLDFIRFFGLIVIFYVTRLINNILIQFFYKLQCSQNNQIIEVIHFILMEKPNNVENINKKQKVYFFNDFIIN